MSEKKYKKRETLSLSDFSLTKEKIEKSLLEAFLFWKEKSSSQKKERSLRYYGPLKGLVWSLSIGRGVNPFKIFRELDRLGIKNPFVGGSFTEAGVRNAIESLTRDNYLRKTNDGYMANLEIVLNQIKSKHLLVKIEKPLTNEIINYRKLFYISSLVLFHDLYVKKSPIPIIMLKTKEGRNAFLYAVLDEIVQLFISPTHLHLLEMRVLRREIFLDFVNKYYSGSKEFKKEVKSFERRILPFFETLETKNLREIYLCLLKDCIENIVLGTEARTYYKALKNVKSEEDFKKIGKTVTRELLTRRKEMKKKVKDLLIDYMRNTPDFVLKRIRKQYRTSRLKK